MARAVWTPLAEDDLEDILYQIRVVNKRPLAARRNGEAIHNAVNARASVDVPGQIHLATPPGWLYFRFKRWLIFYQPHPKGIEVMRVIDGARDLPKHLVTPEG